MVYVVRQKRLVLHTRVEHIYSAIFGAVQGLVSDSEGIEEVRKVKNHRTADKAPVFQFTESGIIRTVSLLRTFT